MPANGLSDRLAADPTGDEILGTSDSPWSLGTRISGLGSKQSSQQTTKTDDCLGMPYGRGGQPGEGSVGQQWDRPPNS